MMKYKISNNDLEEISKKAIMAGLKPPFTIKKMAQQNYDVQQRQEPYNTKLVTVPATVFVNLDEEGHVLNSELVIFSEVATESSNKIEIDPQEIIRKYPMPLQSGLHIKQHDEIGETYNSIDDDSLEFNEQGAITIDGTATYKPNSDNASGIVEFKASDPKLSQIRLSIPVGIDFARNFMLKDFGKGHPLYPEYYSENAPKNTGEIVDQNKEDEGFLNEEKGKEQYFKRLDFINSKLEDFKSAVSMLAETIKSIPSEVLDSLGISKSLSSIIDGKNLNAFEYWFGKLSGDNKTKSLNTMSFSNLNIVESQIYNKLFNRKILKEVKEKIDEKLTSIYKACQIISDVVRTLSKDDVLSNINGDKTKVATNALAELAEKYMTSIENIYSKIGASKIATINENILIRKAMDSINKSLEENLSDELSEKILNSIAEKAIEAGMKPPFGIKKIAKTGRNVNES